MNIFLNILFLFFFLFFSTNKTDDNTKEIALKTLYGKNFSLSEIKNYQASVFIFLSPECPLCQSYTLTIKNFHRKYDSLNIKFYGVFPGKYYNKKSIKKFVKKYGLEFPILLDPEYNLTKKFAATITPETFVLDSSVNILYSGKIDNWAYEPGKKRTVITEFYLRDVLDSITEGKAVAPKKTEPVGCFIFQQDEK